MAVEKYGFSDRIQVRLLIYKVKILTYNKEKFGGALVMHLKTTGALKGNILETKKWKRKQRKCNQKCKPRHSVDSQNKKRLY